MDRETQPSAAATASGSHEHVTRNLRWVSLCTILSRVLGLVRDSVMASRFGNGVLLDAFTVAFRIPNLARALLGEGALATAFLPLYLRMREEQGREAANRLAVAVLITLVGALLMLLAVAEIVLISAGFWAHWSAEADLLRQLLIWLMPYVVLICVAAQLGALLNAERQFLIPALVPSVLNLVWLGGLWSITGWWDAESQLFAMSGAILLGGVFQVALPLWAAYRQGLRFDAAWRTMWPMVVLMMGQMAPVVGGLMVTQVNVLADSLIAWGFAAPPTGDSTGYPLTAGTASALYFGQRLYQFPLGVFGVALGTVLFPLLAEHAQSRQFDRLRDDFSLGLRYVAAIGIPASVGLMLMAGPLASLCFEYGAFSAEDARTTAGMIAAYGSGVWSYSGLLIIHRGFYSLGDRITPLKIGLLSVGLNITLSLTLIWVFGGVALAATTSLVSMLQCLLAGEMIRRKIGGWDQRAIARAIAAATLASLLMGLAGGLLLWSLSEWTGWQGRLARVGLPCVVAVAVYFAACWGLRFREPFEILLRRRPAP